MEDQMRQRHREYSVLAPARVILLFHRPLGLLVTTVLRRLGEPACYVKLWSIVIRW
jgi:hypothetical protein